MITKHPLVVIHSCHCDAAYQSLFLPYLPDKSGFIIPPSYTNFDRSGALSFQYVDHVNHIPH